MNAGEDDKRTFGCCSLSHSGTHSPVPLTGPVSLEWTPHPTAVHNNISMMMMMDQLHHRRTIPRTLTVQLAAVEEPTREAGITSAPLTWKEKIIAIILIIS